jgi:oligopeptide/dipeptide ABC transporter ATP-binding protein
MVEPLLEARNLRKTFSGVAAVDGVSLELAAGETLAIVGESGSGKTTLARILLRLIEPDSGELLIEGRDFLAARGAELRALRREMQMVFQDPFGSLDPRLRVGEIVGEPLEIHEPQMVRSARLARVVETLRAVGLGEDALTRYPHEFSGGQRQRIGIARALVLEPEVLICDEPISALDVSIKSQIANLLKDLQVQTNLSLLFIAHDLAAVRFSCDRVLVLYLGRIMEVASRTALFAAPRHPYTRALLQSVPIADPVRARARRSAPLSGEIPSPLAPPSGCVFRTRCPYVISRCETQIPVPRTVGDSWVACHRAEEI